MFQKSIDNRYLKHVVQHNAEHEMKNKCYLIRMTRSFPNHKIRIILESAIKAELRAKELRYWHTSTVYCHSQKLKSYSRLVQHNKRLTLERTAPEVSFEWWHASRFYPETKTLTTCRQHNKQYHMEVLLNSSYLKSFIMADAKSKNHNSQIKLKHFSKAVSLEVTDWLDSTSKNFSEKRVLTLAVPRGYQNNAVR